MTLVYVTLRYEQPNNVGAPSIYLSRCTYESHTATLSVRSCVRGFTQLGRHPLYIHTIRAYVLE
jgi:hypothetical protein